MKQIKLKKISGQIEVLTGLHIGAGNDVIEIGGMDNPIIKNPVTGHPYIPGSSLKGKMRSLSEWWFGKVTSNNGNPCNCGKCEICKVFGTSADKAALGPTRLIVRDAHINEEHLKKEVAEGHLLVEEKYENSLNRITARANPRPIERVVPGTIFDFEMVYRVIDNGDGGSEDEKNFKEVVLKAMALLEHDYLGGGGSRGNGKIRFIHLKDEEGKDIELPEV
ncbi:MAG: type III-A CRISPR-associated RAMP protein Csm3 [Calditrichia bacterium]